MARPTWKGNISFGLVNVPIQMFTAVRKHDVNFRQVHASTKARVRRKRVDAETGEEVPNDEIVKGYEVGDGQYLVVDPEELEQLDPDRSRTIEIRDFVEVGDIDPIYFDRPYYLAPDGEGAARPYRLLTEAMERTGKAAIATFVMRTKEYLAAIRARDGVLILSTMNFADEVADPADLDVPELDDVEVQDREVEMAEQLIENLLTDFDPTAYRDEHQERIREYLESKAEGQEVHLPERAEETGEVVDLMSALEQSLRGAAGEGAGAASDEEDLESMTRDELYELAQQRDVPGRSGMSKSELVEALQEAEATADAA